MHKEKSSIADGERERERAVKGDRRRLDGKEGERGEKRAG